MRPLLLFFLLFGYTSLFAVTFYPKQSYCISPTPEIFVDRDGVRLPPNDNYRYPPRFWDGLDVGMAVLRENNQIVFLDKAGEILFKVPTECYTAERPYLFSEGHLRCFQEPKRRREKGTFFFLNFQGRQSKQYTATRAAGYESFRNGRAAVLREGKWYLLDYDYNEIYICTQREGTPYPFFAGSYALLHLKRPTPQPPSWPWPYDTLAVIDQSGRTIVQFPLTTKIEPYTFGYLASSMGCLVPVIEGGEHRYRYYLFNKRCFLKDFSCTKISEDGFRDDAIIVEDNEGLIILNADGQWVRPKGDYAPQEEWPLWTYFNCGLARLARNDGSHCLVNKKGKVIQEVPKGCLVHPMWGDPFWFFVTTEQTYWWITNRELKVILRGP